MINQRIIGSLLIALGALFTLEAFGWVQLSWNFLWPLFLLLPGIIFHIGFFAGNNKNPGLLVPGGILTVYGILFIIMVFLGWDLMKVLWPVFPLGVALGLFELYIFGSREPGLLIPVGILSLVGFGFLLINLLNIGGGALIGLILIGIGGFTLLRAKTG